MKIAFVGVKRKYLELPKEYIYNFNRYHLELPFYYARDGENDVTITTVDMTVSSDYFRLIGDGLKHPKFLEMQMESEFQKSSEKFDVVIHWRKWFPELYRPEALNLLNCQDHSFSSEWKDSVRQAMNAGQLYGILCFPTWHQRNLHQETGIPMERLLAGVTLGVDTDIYRPALVKDPYQMLWASDPGRGLTNASLLAVELFQRDKRFRLHVCQPDYAKGILPIRHPAIVECGNVQNGPRLWELFNSSGILPYTSTFSEPSSRAHRQAQAAGCLVLYPPFMGTPSELPDANVNRIVRPVAEWRDIILNQVESGSWKTFGELARAHAISENWPVQAQRFNLLMNKIRETKNA